MCALTQVEAGFEGWGGIGNRIRTRVRVRGSGPGFVYASVYVSMCVDVSVCVWGGEI